MLTLKKIASALAVSLLTLSSAHALNVVNTITLDGTADTGYSAGLSGPSGTDVFHMVSGAFTDQFTFKFTGGSWVDVSLVTSAAQDELTMQQIVFTSADVNGIAVNIKASKILGGTVLRSASLFQASTNNDLVLTIHGFSGLNGSIGQDIAASYSGTVNVTAVPEPETYVLMLSGLTAIGFMARRRKIV